MNVQRDLKGLSPHSDAARDSRAAAQDLARRAAAEGLVDVAVATMDSPIGELMVAVTPSGAGLRGVRGRGPRRAVRPPRP